MHDPLWSGNPNSTERTRVLERERWKQNQMEQAEARRLRELNAPQPVVKEPEAPKVTAPAAKPEPAKPAPEAAKPKPKSEPAKPGAKPYELPDPLRSAGGVIQHVYGGLERIGKGILGAVKGAFTGGGAGSAAGAGAGADAVTGKTPGTAAGAGSSANKVPRPTLPALPSDEGSKPTTLRDRWDYLKPKDRQSLVEQFGANDSRPTR